MTDSSSLEDAVATALGHYGVLTPAGYSRSELSRLIAADLRAAGVVPAEPATHDVIHRTALAVLTARCPGCGEVIHRTALAVLTARCPGCGEWVRDMPDMRAAVAVVDGEAPAT